jgi:hypothetical protein
LTKKRKRDYNEEVETLPRYELAHGDGRRLFLYGAYDGTPLPLHGNPAPGRRSTCAATP